jgi:hypothetical protein
MEAMCSGLIERAPTIASCAVWVRADAYGQGLRAAVMHA